MYDRYSNLIEEVDSDHKVIFEKKFIFENQNDADQISKSKSITMIAPSYGDKATFEVDAPTLHSVGAWNLIIVINADGLSLSQSPHVI